jgi:hypothetical protein
VSNPACGDRVIGGMHNDLESARQDVSASSAGGAPFLISFGVTLAACAVASWFVPRPTAALLVMFQGCIALPAAFLLERAMSMNRKAMAPDNPLRALSIQMAMSQVVALPVVIAMYSLNPGAVPLAMASIGGGHFLPYGWLQRTRAYVVLGIAVAVGAYAIQIALGAQAFPWVLLFMSACYWVTAPVVYRRARHALRPQTDSRL